MNIITKRKTSLSLDAAALEQARELGINVSAVADKTLQAAIMEATRQKWLQENAQQFDAQANWHAKNGHPLAEIIASPTRCAWSA